MIGEIGAGAIILGWIGSIELRARSFVNKDRFGDLKEQTQRIENKVDALLIHNNLDPKNDDKK